MNVSDTLAIKLLLDFNADIESRTSIGETPLLSVARCSGASQALLLLEANADVNAISGNGKTPLTTAIAYINHDVLRVLLEHWFKYAECPRLQGPSFLFDLADYADLETIRIVSNAEHLRLRHDRQLAIGVAALKRMKKRPDTSDKLVAALEDLLLMMRNEQLERSMEELLEEGKWRLDSVNEKAHFDESSYRVREGTDDLDGEAVFEVYHDALE
jgi:hypothetical protein